MVAPSYTPVLRVGLLGTVTNLFSKEATLSRCSLCSAAVESTATHTAWHADVDTAIAAAQSAADQAALAAQAAAMNECGVCMARVSAIHMLTHLRFHLKRSQNEPIESPASIHADTGVTPTT